MNRLRALVLSGLVACGGLSLSGCGTMWNFEAGADAGGLNRETRIYGGVQVDVQAVGKIAEPWNSGWGRLIAGLFVLDVPFSLAADTLTLPVTIPMALFRSREAPSDRNPEGDESFHAAKK